MKCIVCIAVAISAYAGAPVPDLGVARRQAFMEQYMLGEFSVGVSSTTTWMNETRTNNSCRWRWRAAYMSGGIETGWDKVFLAPWNQWVNPDSIPGMFCRIFINDCIKSGYLPWITMYNLSQSPPANYQPNPPAAIATNILVASTMKAYFEQFKVMMQICAEHVDTPIVIHVEPDEIGHMLLTVSGTTLNPAAVTVKVGSCGFAEINDLPDNVIGYCMALKRLRDTYAPYNALLCVSPSPWDWQGRLSAQNWQTVLNACGINDWDLAVCETGSADLGWEGVNPPYSPLTGMAGGIDNVITWATQLNTLSGLPFVMWQIPIGNTYYKTCNNTNGHFTHNSAQLLLENYPTNTRIQKFADGGGIGLIFSAGQWNSTRPNDEMNDGITNPATIAGNLGNTSIYADDDGGYLRLRVKSYYERPIALRATVQLSITATRVRPETGVSREWYLLDGRRIDGQSTGVSGAGIFLRVYRQAGNSIIQKRLVR